MPWAPPRDDSSSPDAPAIPDPTDDAVVARVLDGDGEAYGVIVRRYHGRCVRYATHLLGDRQDAEDAVQNAFIRSYDALGRYERRERFQAWLFAILTNECRAILASRARRKKFVVDDEQQLANAAAPSHNGDGDTGARIDAALARLDPRLREAFLLHHVEDLPYPEMMRITGAGVSALKMRVKRACEALRAYLEER
jgi:RNA polymerase sigma-70 factor (ECF subfamily)